MPTNKELFNAKMTALANAINTKAGTTGAKDLDALKTTVDSIPTGGGGEQPQLNAVTISFQKNTLKITNPRTNGNFVSKYKIYVDNEFEAETTNLTYDFSSISKVTASVYVVACGTNFIDSPNSNTATFEKYFTVQMYDGQTLLETEEVLHGTMPSYVPTKSGYRFDYWMDENDNQVTQINQNTNLYAKWVLTSIIAAGTYNLKSNATKPSSYYEIYFNTNVTFTTQSGEITKNALTIYKQGSMTYIGFGNEIESQQGVTNILNVALFSGNAISIIYNGFTFAQNAEVTPTEYERFNSLFELATQ